MKKNIKIYFLFFFCVLLIVLVWLYTLKLNLTKPEKNNNEGLSKIFNSLKNIDDSFKNIPPLPKNTTSSQDIILAEVSDKLLELTTTSTPTSTADWQIYKNENYKFEIKIPTNYIAEETGIKEISFSTKELIDAELQNIKDCNDDKEETVCAPEMIGNRLEFTAYFQFSEEEKINKKVETLNGVSWHIFEVPGLYSITYYETQKDSQQYHFSSMTSQQEEIRKILSTFKFIE